MKKCPRAIFLHCLPRGSEVDENVFKSKQSKVWLQALNRIRTKIYTALLSRKIKVKEVGYQNFGSGIILLMLYLFLFLNPAKAILVPLIHFAGLIR